METPELKPCPFCGGEAEARGSISSYVACTKCEAEGPFFEVHFFPTSENVDEADKLAIAAWNTRIPQQPQWEQMTEETTFEDGEELLAIIRRRRVCVEYVLDGDEFVAAIPSSNSVSVGFQRNKISKFIRIPK